MNSKSKSNYKKRSNVKYDLGGLTNSQNNLISDFQTLFNIGADVFPQLKFDGGPIIPGNLITQESTSVKQIPVNEVPQVDFEKQQMLNTMAEMTKNLGAFGSSGKVKSKPRFHEKALGGILSAGLTTFADGAIPGLGSIIGPLLESMDNDTKEPPTPLKTSTNIYGKFKKGGFISKDFKQYNTGSHDSGNDLGVDVNGNPSNNADGGFVQNQENAYKFDNGTYIMSDTLTNPVTGNKFNVDAAKINKKYKDSYYIGEDKNALDFEMKNLANLNDSVRPVQSEKHFTGGPAVDPRFKYNVNTETTPLETFDDNLPYNLNMLSKNIPTFSMIPQDLPTDNTNIINNQEIVGGRSVESLPASSSNPTTDTNLGSFNYNGAAIALKGLALGKSIVDALTPAEKESPILPNYAKSDKQFYNANIDYTQARQDSVAASNLALNVNRASSSGFQSYQGRQAINFANLADQFSRIGEQETNQRSQLALTRGQYETNKAVDKANRLYQNRIDNQMNQANADLADQKLFSELSQIGTTFNDYQYYKDMLKNNTELSKMKIQEASAILGSKYENFGFDKTMIDKISNGDYTDIDMNDLIRFISTADKIKGKQ